MKRLILPSLMAALVFVGAGCSFSSPGHEMTVDDVIKSQQLTDLAISMLDDIDKNVYPPDEAPTIKKRHVIGTSPCPDPIEPFTITSPSGKVEGPGVATTDVPWLFIPDDIEIGQPVQLKFNCNIGDYSAHIEDGTVTFNFGDEQNTDENMPVHDFDLAEQNNFTVTLKVQLGACSSKDTCPAGYEE